MSIMIIISIIISIIIILGSYILNKRVFGIDKLSQYECGFEPIEEKPGIETRDRFYLKFYMVGIIFLIFDLEAILLYPYTTILLNLSQSKKLGGDEFISFGSDNGYIVFIIFMYILILGLIYEYKKGVLD